MFRWSGSSWWLASLFGMFPKQMRLLSDVHDAVFSLFLISYNFFAFASPKDNPSPYHGFLVLSNRLSVVFSSIILATLLLKSEITYFLRSSCVSVRARYGGNEWGRVGRCRYLVLSANFKSKLQGIVRLWLMRHGVTFLPISFCPQPKR